MRIQVPNSPIKIPIYIVLNGVNEFKIEAMELSIPEIAYAYMKEGKKVAKRALKKTYFHCSLFIFFRLL